MIFAYILTAAIIAYYIGYHRGHTAALAVPYQLLADYMAELIRRTQPDKEHDPPTTP